VDRQQLDPAYAGPFFSLLTTDSSAEGDLGTIKGKRRKVRAGLSNTSKEERDRHTKGTGEALLDWVRFQSLWSYLGEVRGANSRSEGKRCDMRFNNNEKCPPPS